MILYYYKVIIGRMTEHCYTYKQNKTDAIKEAKARAKRVKGKYTDLVEVNNVK